MTHGVLGIKKSGLNGGDEVGRCLSEKKELVSIKKCQKKRV